MFRVAIALMTLAASFGYAQQSSPNAEAGKQLYQVNCSNCHGPNGNFVSGVDLMHGKFRRASTDNELVAIMVQGIPGTPMPPANLTDPQARSIVAFLRHMAQGTRPERQTRPKSRAAKPSSKAKAARPATASKAKARASAPT